MAHELLLIRCAPTVLNSIFFNGVRGNFQLLGCDVSFHQICPSGSSRVHPLENAIAHTLEENTHCYLGLKKLSPGLCSEMEYIKEDGCSTSCSPTFAERRESLLKLNRLFLFEERRLKILTSSKTLTENVECDFPGKSELQREILVAQKELKQSKRAFLAMKAAAKRQYDFGGSEDVKKAMQHLEALRRDLARRNQRKQETAEHVCEAKHFVERSTKSLELIQEKLARKKKELAVLLTENENPEDVGSARVGD